MKYLLIQELWFTCAYDQVTLVIETYSFSLFVREHNAVALNERKGVIRHVKEHLRRTMYIHNTRISRAARSILGSLVSW